MLVERARFGPHVMVSAGVCFVVKGLLHFVEEKAKIIAHYYMNDLLPKLVNDCHDLLGDDIIFQQNGAPAQQAKVTQEWLNEHCPDFIDKDCWPPNSPDLNPLDYHVWGAMLQEYMMLNPKPQNLTELKVVLQAKK